MMTLAGCFFVQWWAINVAGCERGNDQPSRDMVTYLRQKQLVPDQRYKQTRGEEHRPRLRASTQRHAAGPMLHPTFAARSIGPHCRNLSTNDGSMRAMHGSTLYAAECTAQPLVRETTPAVGRLSIGSWLQFRSKTTNLILRARVELGLDTKNCSDIHVGQQSLTGCKSTDTWVFPLPVSIYSISARWFLTLIEKHFETYNNDRVPLHAPFEHLLLVAPDVEVRLIDIHLVLR